MSKPTTKEIISALTCGRTMLPCNRCAYAGHCSDAAEDAAKLIEDQSSEILELKTLVKAAAWHDLTKNPDDLPEPNNPVLCCYRYIGYNTPRWYEAYGIGYIVLEVDIGKVSYAWRGHVTGGKCPQVLRWQRINDPLKEETKCK